MRVVADVRQADAVTHGNVFHGIQHIHGPKGAMPPGFTMIPSP